MERPVLFLDISRLVRRYENFGGPTGIDRVELVYARWLARQKTFEPVAVTRGRGGLLALRPQALATVADTLERRFAAPDPPGFGREARSPARYAAERATRRLARWRLLAGAALPSARGRASVYLNVGHDSLDTPQIHAGLTGAKVAFVHDVIPLTHPEYDTPRSTALHARRIATLAAHFDHVITISEATRAALEEIAPQRRFTTAAVHLGPALAAPPTPARFETPTFVHVSTLNRRKNTALLLHIWRDLAQLADPPRLVLIGRRGNDGTVIDLLDRCAALRPVVSAPGALDDGETARLLAGARALLSPSFAEGFGLPLVEAHVMGVPAVASDIPAHREVAREGTIHLCPLDGHGWRDTILALARDDTRHAALRAAIRPPATWQDHFAAVEPTLAALAR